MSINTSYTKDLSIVVPIYNEEKGIPELVRRLSAAAASITEDYELIFVNDGSRDGSMELLRSLCKGDDRFFYINLSRNFGHQIAVSAGLDHVRGKATVIIDGDLQDPPELISELYAKYREGYEVVYAQRKHREGETWFKKATAKGFYRTMRKITSIDMPLDTGDFRLIDRKIVQCLREMPEQNKLLRGQIAWMGFRQTGYSSTETKEIRPNELSAQEDACLGHRRHHGIFQQTARMGGPIRCLGFFALVIRDRLCPHLALPAE